MNYDIDLIRLLLRAFGSYLEPQHLLLTDGVNLSPPAGFGLGEEVHRHVDRLLTVGLLRRTHEIYMLHHEDPPTLRATEFGREWIRRAYDDLAWTENLSELAQLLENDVG